MDIDAELARYIETPFPNDFDDIVTTRRLQKARLDEGADPRGTPATSVTWSDQEISGPASSPTLLVRIYSKPSLPQPSGALLFFHGGAFVLGDLDSEHQRCIRYCEQGECVVMSVDYRLAPENPFPAAFDDGVAALEWLSANAGSLGVDPSRIGVGGASAGGEIAAGVVLHARDVGHPGVRAQLLVHPVTDNETGTPSVTQFFRAEPFDGERAQKMWTLYLGPDHQDVSPYASVARATDLRNMPPTYIVTAELDPLRDEGINYATALIASGNTVELHHFPRTYHGFDAVAPSARLSQRALDEQSRFLLEELAN
jgi:acetyl esterase/lipase